LVEAMISVVVLTIGLVAVLSVFAVAVSSMQNVQMDQIARQKATETLESIFTARQTAQLSFASIQNTPNGIFTPGIVYSIPMILVGAWLIWRARRKPALASS